MPNPINSISLLANLATLFVVVAASGCADTTGKTGKLAQTFTTPQYRLAQTLDNPGANDIAVADFDNDGDLDFATANGVWNKKLPSHVWINNGSGYFTVLPNGLGDDKSWSVSAEDFNNDGKADLIFGNGDWNTGAQSKIWLNNALNFTSSQENFPIKNTSAITTGDFNSDGRPDIYFANHPLSNETEGEDTLWLSSATEGTVSLAQTLSGNGAARKAASADLDNDKHTDLVVLNGNAANQVLINDGQGHFVIRETLGTGENTDLAICDIDNNGYADVLIVKGAWGKPGHGIEIWKNNGNAKFYKAANLGQHKGYAIACHDLNRDGCLDVIVVNNEPQANQIFINHCDGTFQLAPREIGSGGTRVVAANINADDRPDIIITDSGSTRVYMAYD